MKFCPFVSGSTDPPKTSHVFCNDKCAIYLNGKCSLLALAEALELRQQQAEFEKSKE